MVLLSLEGKQVDEIAEITHRCRDTVLKWLHRWNEKGFDELKDRPYIRRILHQNSLAWKKPGTRDFCLFVYSSNAESKATAEGSKSTLFTNLHASAAPCSLSIPLSSHSTESGPV